MQNLLTTAQVCEILAISRSTLWNLGKKGLLRPRAGFVGNRYSQDDINNYLKNLPVKDAYKTDKEIKEQLKKAS